MSLAQRRTAPEGIDPVLEYEVDDNGNRQTYVNNTSDDGCTGGDSTQDTSVHFTKNDEIWHTISYDPFAPKPLQHYESFPPEITENKAAYEVSATKRAGKS